MFMATAPQWRGPYDFTTLNLFPSFSQTHIEDAHMWRQTSANGTVSWHAIFHSDVENKCDGAAGGHAWSEDGVRWTFSESNAYCNVVEFTNGTSMTLYKRERPHLLTDEFGRPLLLTNGVGTHHDCDRTWTLAQQVARGPKAPKANDAQSVV